MLFNLLIGFVFCFIVALLAINPRATKAEVLINVAWRDHSPNDIDTWVQDPGDRLVWFRQREAGLMYLDRDDRGDANASTLVNGRRIQSPFRPNARRSTVARSPTLSVRQAAAAPQRPERRPG